VEEEALWEKLTGEEEARWAWRDAVHQRLAALEQERQQQPPVQVATVAAAAATYGLELEIWLAENRAHLRG